MKKKEESIGKGNPIRKGKYIVRTEDQPLKSVQRLKHYKSNYNTGEG